MEKRGDYSWPVSLLNQGTPLAQAGSSLRSVAVIRVYDEAGNANRGARFHST